MSIEFRDLRRQYEHIRPAMDEQIEDSAIADCPFTEKLCEEVLCLPIHPYLDDSEIDFVMGKFRAAISGWKVSMK